MSKPAAIAADFATFKAVPSRKVFQIVLEVPEERTAEVLAALGVPMSGASLPVAVARLTTPQQIEAVPTKPEPARLPRRFDSLPLPQQAALMCQDDGFWRYLCQRNIAVSSVDSAVEWLRGELGIRSRSEIEPGTKVAEAFFRIRDGYQLWSRGIAA